MAHHRNQSNFKPSLPAHRLVVAMVIGGTSVLALSSSGDANVARLHHSTIAWSQAQELPGFSKLLRPGSLAHGNWFDPLISLSCTQAGDCSGGGAYPTPWQSQAGTNSRAFVVDEVNGDWNAPIEVPGIARLDSEFESEVDVITCTSPGNCTAAGTTSHDAVFLVSEIGGHWQRAMLAPGYGQVARTAYVTYVDAIVCTEPGDCLVGGWGQGNAGNNGGNAFVLEERDGTWLQARALPGLARIGLIGSGSVSSVSCSNAGDCVAVGGITTRAGDVVPFLDVETAWRWGQAVIPGGTARLVGSVGGVFDAVSCHLTTCVATGTYGYVGGRTVNTFAATDEAGAWTPVRSLPNSIRLNTQEGYNPIPSDDIACPSSTWCEAISGFSTRHHYLDTFSSRFANSTWFPAEPIPASGQLSGQDTPSMSYLSCAQAGECVAVGSGVVRGNELAAVAIQIGGRWSRSQVVPGSERLLQHGDSSQITAVSCAPSGYCVLDGSYGTGDPVTYFPFVASIQF
jgi:hypothetical protein